MALVYVVEDDENIREIEEYALKGSGYLVKSFDRASAFFASVRKEKPDLVILDVMLPDTDGVSIVRELRAVDETAALPIIMVSAKTRDLDVVKALDEGADDYVRKPFSVMELISRVNRRLSTVREKSETLKSGEIEMNVSGRQVYVNGEPVTLTYKEFELLRLLMDNLSTALSREQILMAVWGYDYEGESRTLDMHVKTLRQKLGEAGKRIRTVRNVGYLLNEKETES